MWGRPWKWKNNYKSEHFILILKMNNKKKNFTFKNEKTKTPTFELFSNRFVWVQPPLKHTVINDIQQLVWNLGHFSLIAQHFHDNYTDSAMWKDQNCLSSQKSTTFNSCNELNIHLVWLGAETEQHFSMWPENQLSCLRWHCV